MTLAAIAANTRQLARRTSAFLLGCMTLVETELAFAGGAGGGGLTEAQSAVQWVLDIFSPALMVLLLTIGLIICGVLVWMGRMSGRTFVAIMIGSVLVFGARTIAPKIQQAIGV